MPIFWHPVLKMRKDEEAKIPDDLTFVKSKLSDRCDNLDKKQCYDPVEIKKKDSIKNHEYDYLKKLNSLGSWQEQTVAFTDGSTVGGNPGPSGVGCTFLLPTGKFVSYSKNIGDKTNQQAELKAVGFAINKIDELTDMQSVTIMSDSKYAVNCLSGTWNIKSNFNIYDDIKSKIDEMRSEKNEFEINYKWLPGHENIIPNEIADMMAEKSARQRKETSINGYSRASRKV